ncbi:MAG: 16S rRNA (cytosine(1402)-N(4))-methyltransferase, partial [Candidatus Koribacter versatilis]|nr:16S rRNA (cytosine(1402)-N(4))-methyltransferase [Candidatus Koribacter versatilis]
KHVVIPSPEETRMNPRARSAKMRVAEKLPPPPAGAEKSAA